MPPPPLVNHQSFYAFSPLARFLDFYKQKQKKQLLRA